MTENDILNLLDLTEEELWIELGKRTYQKDPVIGVMPPSLKKLSDIGKKWFNDNKELIKLKLCNTEAIKKLISTGETMENIHLCVAIISLLKPLFEEIHIVLISSIIVKKGITFICN